MNGKQAFDGSEKDATIATEIKALAQPPLTDHKIIGYFIDENTPHMPRDSAGGVDDGHQRHRRNDPRYRN